MKRDSGPHFFIKKDLGPGLFIDLGGGGGIIIRGKNSFEIVRSGTWRPTSPELLEYPDLILAAEDFYRDSKKTSEFFLALESVNRRMGIARAKNKPPASGQNVNIQNPPKIAEFLLTALLKPSHADGVTGDLNEHFADECQKLGRDRAVRLYWARTLRSLLPLLQRKVGKALKWGAVIAAVRRLF